MSEARRLRAPRTDRAILAEPPLEAVGQLLADNRRILAKASSRFPGQTWSAFQQNARQEVLAAARAYLREHGEPVPDWDGETLLMAGHQPDLFHPGVWVKNFALHGLARKHRAVPINLIVDNDTVKSTALHVPAYRFPPPSIESFEPSLLTVPFDYGIRETSFEERTVHDEAVFADFPKRVPHHWNFQPILPEFWASMLQQKEGSNLLGERLAAARRTWERRWGCHNLELPISRLSQTQSFAAFACQLLQNLPRFHAIYNACVQEYRVAHGIRSRNHPVPDLAALGDWLESPFWAWRAGATRRGRLLARQLGERLELRAGEQDLAALPRDADAALAIWQNLEHSGWKVRPRALTNTLFARLFLCDLFIHGIGGGKYDELTDEIMRRYYGIKPPRYLVLSATLLLPFPAYPAMPDECRELAHELRDLHWNPQRHINLDGPQAKLALQKQAWIHQEPADRRGRRERFQVLRELTDYLRGYTAPEEQTLRDRVDRCRREVNANQILQRRDYAFCLYPEELLRGFLTAFL